MEQFTYTEEPLYGKNGKQIGVDRIRRYINPPEETPIKEGCVRVHCICGKIYNNVAQYIWEKWPKGIMKNCKCTEYMNGYN